MLFGIQWKCDTGTAKRKSYIDTSNKCENKIENSKACSGCSHAHD